jgi:paraquat-inducible protein B
MAVHKLEKLAKRQSPIAIAIELREQVLEELGQETAFWVVDATIGAVLEDISLIFAFSTY